MSADDETKADRRLSVGFYHATLPRPAGRKGGVEAAVHRLANALARRDQIDITVYSSGEPPPDALYHHERVLERSNARRLTQLLLSPALLNRLGLGARHDVLHLHGDDWFFVRRRAASVRTMYGSAWHEARTARRWARRTMMALVFVLEKLSVRLATVNVSIGRQTAAIYDADYVVGMTVDLALFQPGEKAPDPTIFFVGGWSERKRGAFLFHTFVDQVLPAMPTARLVMVTDDCPDHPSVTALRGVSDAALARQMAAAWVFGYPSLYEGFGIAYIEAMACGTAIVATPNAGADEVLDGGRYGEVVPDAAFGAALIAMLRDGERRRALEHAGLARAAEFDIDRIAAQNERIYAEAIRRYRQG